MKQCFILTVLTLVLIFAWERTYGAPHFTEDELVYYKRTGINYIPNGSFELGLGAEPIYPGWLTKMARTPIPPDHPVIVDDGHTGSKSLMIRNVHSNIKLTIFTTPQNIIDEINNSPDGKAYFYVGYWLKSTKPGVTFRCNGWEGGKTIKEEEVNKWVYHSFKEDAKSIYRNFYMTVSINNSGPCDIQIDDICITLDPNTGGVCEPADDVEAILIPSKRADDLYFAGDPIQLKYSMMSHNQARDTRLELHLKDLSREGKTTYPFELDSLNLPSDTVVKGNIDLGTLKNGAYMAILAVEDKNTGKLLTVTKERFTVMYDTTNTPPFVDYITGSYGGCRGWSMEYEFSWRGSWNVDEFYSTSFLIGKRIERVMIHPSGTERYEGAESSWLDAVEFAIDKALEHNCYFMPCVNVVGKYDPVKHLLHPENPSAWFFTKTLDVPKSHKMNTPSIHAVALMRDNIRDFLKKIAIRWGHKVPVVELHNELNLALNGEETQQYVFEPGYRAFKKIAPNVPLIMNQTMDGIYSSEANHFTKLFMTQGGVRFSDGFSFHPYGRGVIWRDTNKGNGIEYIKLMKHFKDDYSEPGRTMVLGQSEILNIGQVGTPAWEFIQRFLLDWVGTCKWSAGIAYDGMCFLESGILSPWYFRGPHTPGTGAVALNAMQEILGGCAYQEMVDKDKQILVALFKVPNDSKFVVAMAAGSIVDKCPEITIDLSGLKNVKVFDMYGAEIQWQKPYLLTRNAVYITSTDSALLKRARNFSFNWVTNYSNFKYRKDDTQPDFHWELLCTGETPRVK